MAMKKEGVSEEEAKSKIWMVDSKGLIVKNRPSGGISEHKVQFAREHPPVDSLAEVVKLAKPSVLIGAAAIGGAFTRQILEEMGKNNARPVIFALSNPTSKAECTAEEAYNATEVIFKQIKKILHNQELLVRLTTNFYLSGSRHLRKWLALRPGELRW